VIDLLVFVKLTYVLVFGIAGPHDVPIVGFLNHLKTGVLESIHHCVVYMCRVVDAESHK
jgi:hypothetical protein